MLEEQVAVGKSGRHTASICFSAPSWEEVTGCGHTLFSPSKESKTGIVYITMTSGQRRKMYCDLI